MKASVDKMGADISKWESVIETRKPQKLATQKYRNTQFESESKMCVTNRPFQGAQFIHIASSKVHHRDHYARSPSTKIDCTGGCRSKIPFEPCEKSLNSRTNCVKCPSYSNTTLHKLTKSKQHCLLLEKIAVCWLAIYSYIQCCLRFVCSKLDQEQTTLYNITVDC